MIVIDIIISYFVLEVYFFLRKQLELKRFEKKKRKAKLYK